MAKWVAQIDRADRIPEYVARAFATALRRAARARSCWRCPRTCSPARRDAADAPPFHVVQPHPGAEQTSSALRELLARPSGRS